MPLRQNQETAVIGQQIKTRILVPEMPADPAIPRAAFQGCRGKTQQRNPLTEIGGNVPKGFSDFGQRA